MDFTPFVKSYFINRAKQTDAWISNGDAVQLRQLSTLLTEATLTEIGGKYRFAEFRSAKDKIRLYEEFSRRLPIVAYEDIRDDVMRMLRGEKDVLWSGKCYHYAQSSGTSDGKSKYIPITRESFRRNHYKGASDAMAHYLRLVPTSKVFSGKGLILGGSFANELKISDKRICVGDLSANLIKNINPIVNLFRLPDKQTALMSDWKAKLPALVRASLNANITNISGVPSWFLTLLQEVMKAAKATNINDVWPNLEVFFHGGISFEPYRAEYKKITDQSKMHFLETYNASEGFFATQNDFLDSAMLLILDAGIFYEFAPLEADGSLGNPVAMWDIDEGKTYALIITSCNGLWRYSIGDTVRIEQKNPLKIKIVGRTKSFINAFGEELMQHNADEGIAVACEIHNASIRNYTAAPVFATDGKRGRHQWLIEWIVRPSDVSAFADTLDKELQRVNSDYQAKRNNNIFLDNLSITDARDGVFDEWLKSVGSGKLGGQRKVPRLSNSREIIDAILAINKKE